jgi:hypothetical protein
MGLELSVLACFNEEREVDYSSIYPRFYLKHHEFTKENIYSVQESWHIIQSNELLKFFELKAATKFEFASSFEYFSHTFKNIFTDMYPSISLNQASVICNTATFNELLEHLDDLNKVYIKLAEIAKYNAKHGNHAILYGIVAQVFLLSLQTCLDVQFTDYNKSSWIKVVIYHNYSLNVTNSFLDFEFYAEYCNSDIDS